MAACYHIESWFSSVNSTLLKFAFKSLPYRRLYQSLDIDLNLCDRVISCNTDYILITFQKVLTSS